MDLNLDDLFSQANIQCGDLLSTAVQPTIDGSLLQNICEEMRRSNSNQDCILQELKLINRNIETLCQQRQYIFSSPPPVKVPVDIEIRKIIENYKTSKKEDYVGYDEKKQKNVTNAKRKTENNSDNQCKRQHTDDGYRKPLIAGRGKYEEVLKNYKIPKKSKQTNKSSR